MPTYVYCLVASSRRPRLARVPRGLAGTGPVRLLDVEPGVVIAVADAAASRYSGRAIERGLRDLDWVSRAAVAHEAVVESFVGAKAVLPMKLFTLFTNDASALEHVRAERVRIDAVIKRVADQDEWGVRIVLDPKKPAAARSNRKAAREASGAGYLAMKKARRDATIELAQAAQKTVDAAFRRLARGARQSRRRTAADLPIADGPLLLDAAFLVPRRRGASFRAVAAREARALAPRGYAVTLTGPWPPYSFVQE